MSIIVTSGEPAGIGPDIILKSVANEHLDMIVLGDINLFEHRATQLGLKLNIIEYQEGVKPACSELVIRHIPLNAPCIPGQLNEQNAAYIIRQLDDAIDGCMNGFYSAMVTAPVHKSIINQAGIPFTGHTEYIAVRTQSQHDVVMMLASKTMRVALVTTHAPLKEVPNLITIESVQHTTQVVLDALKHGFGIAQPKVMVAGLNPHAGENGYLGREELDIIEPALRKFDSNEVVGPVSADTMFSNDNLKSVDAFIAMYHDQGLCPLKALSFGEAVNITLGARIVRTSVDHGTALALAGTGMADERSFKYAITQAQQLGKGSHRRVN